MSDKNSVVATFDHHSKAEAAVRELQRAGFKVESLSIVGKGYHTEEKVVGYYTTGDRMLNWGQNGAFWGGMWGLLFGSAFFAVPGVGPLLVAGPLVVWIVAALESAAVAGRPTRAPTSSPCPSGTPTPPASTSARPCPSCSGWTSRPSRASTRCTR